MHRTSTRTLTALTLAAALVAAPLAVSAASGAPAEGSRHHQKFQHKSAHGGQHQAMRQGAWLGGLDLSQEQRDQIFKIRQNQAQAVYDQQKAVRSAAQTLREAGAADSFDQDKAAQAAQALGQAQGQLALLRAQTEAQIRAVLTPEQRTKMAERRNKRKPASPAKS